MRVASLGHKIYVTYGACPGGDTASAEYQKASYAAPDKPGDIIVLI